MKLHYHPETDSLYIELKAEPGAESREVVRFDIDQASKHLNLTTLETTGLPLRGAKAA